ncbi:coiled-coil domain-containing protein 169-like [Sinocyclocheilus grahami]|uniref:coiled-coil domain-containing protein 169-like n=1 Tax=Sinocyclocheilus grahami TaxID=75366 RepID=UPI0007ACFDD0|nr:PREDICTED: coiled-coil domain-containing protein 169-like [Sinocyclocheilus grahami]
MFVIRYGDEAGQAADTAVHSAVNVGITAFNVDNLGIKGILKTKGKHTAKAMLSSFPGPSSADAGPSARWEKLISEIELSQLQAEVEQEREVKEMLHDSMSDLRSTLADLEKTLHSVDGEDRLASIRSYDEISEDALRQRLKLLSSEKSGLQSQMMDFQMRIVQEGKIYQKVYEERRAYLEEIAKLSSTLDMSRKQQMVQARRTALGPDKTEM